MNDRVGAASALARARATSPIVAPTDTRATRWLVAGDPQTTPERFFAVLDAHDALADDGSLQRDVGLVSMGDHFDFHMGAAEAEASGRAILAWLYAEERTIVLAGNHDVARVAELAFETDATYAAAKALARELGQAYEAASEPDVTRLSRAFAERFPSIPSAGIVVKDFASFSEAQRTLVEAGMLAGKMRLSALAIREGCTFLLTHAGVTTRERALLALADDAGAEAFSRALDAFFAHALVEVAPSWRRGQRARLAIEPLHVAGKAAREGGGLLYHRPAKLDRVGADPAWEAFPEAPRRFDPRTLPRGVAQIVGHSGHARCVRDLGEWVVPAATAGNVALRTLRAGDTVVYEPFVSPPRAGEATCLMVDPGFADAPLDTIALLPVEGVAFAK